MTEKINISFTEKFPLIRCKFCNASFVLIYYYEDEESEERAYGDTFDPYWGKQVTSNYCPYCGKKFKS